MVENASNQEQMLAMHNHRYLPSKDVCDEESETSGDGVVEDVVVVVGVVRAVKVKVKVKMVAVAGCWLLVAVVVQSGVLCVVVFALRCIALHCITLRCVALHCVALCCVALHYFFLT